MDDPMTLANWAKILRAAAPSVPDFTVGQSAFSDASPQRRSVEHAILAWQAQRCGRSTTPPPALPGADPDVELWWALTDHQVDPARILDAHRGRRGAVDAGSLFRSTAWTAIEVWTEVELSSLHALWWLARSRRQPEWQALVTRTARWHLDNTQPDNATNRPWAIHVFAHIAALDRNPAAQLFAQTQLHNCQVHGGRPDQLSALILLDAAEALETLAGD